MSKDILDKSAASDLPKKAVRKARTATKKVSRAAEKTASSLNEKVTDTVDAASDKVSSAFGQQAESATGFGQRQARKYILNTGRALETASYQLRQDGMSDTAEYIQEAADKLLDAAVSIDNFDPSTARAKAENFIQEKPIVTLGGLALLGFAAAAIMSKRNQ